MMLFSQLSVIEDLTDVLILTVYRFADLFSKNCVCSSNPL